MNAQENPVTLNDISVAAGTPPESPTFYMPVPVDESIWLNVQDLHERARMALAPFKFKPEDLERFTNGILKQARKQSKRVPTSGNPGWSFEDIYNQKIRDAVTTRYQFHQFVANLIASQKNPS